MNHDPDSHHLTMIEGPPLCCCSVFDCAIRTARLAWESEQRRETAMAEYTDKVEEIAGHIFDMSRDAVCRKPKFIGSDEPCGKSWPFVRTATREDIGKPDHPHAPNLTSVEFGEIEARREREDKEEAAIWDAVVGVSSR